MLRLLLLLAFHPILALAANERDCDVGAFREMAERRRAKAAGLQNFPLSIEQLNRYDRSLEKLANPPATSAVDPQALVASELARSLGGSGPSAPAGAKAAPVVRVSAGDVRLTQYAVGKDEIQKDLAKMGKKADSFKDLREAALKIANTELPGVMGPDLWGREGAQFYITDGHHKGDRLYLLLNANYEDLPASVRKVMTPEQQRELARDPALRLSTKIEKTYFTLEEMVRDFSVTNRGLLPETVEKDARFAPVLAKARAGAQLSDAESATLVSAYRHLAPDFERVKDDPVRAALGVAFKDAGLSGTTMKDYAQFLIARGEFEGAIKKLGITSGNAVSDEIQKPLKKLLFDDPKMVAYLRTLARDGNDKSGVPFSKLLNDDLDAAVAKRAAKAEKKAAKGEKKAADDDKVARSIVDAPDWSRTAPSNPPPPGAKPVSFFSGSFDPPTNAHIAIMREAMARNPDENLVVMINTTRGGKDYFTSFEQRAEMIRAQLGADAAKVTMIPDPPGGIESLMKEMRELHPRVDLFVGGDVVDRPTFQTAEGNLNFVVIGRPEKSSGRVVAGAENASIDSEFDGMSSGMARKLARKGDAEGLSAVVGADVAKKIDSEKLYVAPTGEELTSRAREYDQAFEKFHSLNPDAEKPDFIAEASPQSWQERFERKYRQATGKEAARGPAASPIVESARHEVAGMPSSLALAADAVKSPVTISKPMEEEKDFFSRAYDATVGRWRTPKVAEDAAPTSEPARIQEAVGTLSARERAPASIATEKPHESDLTAHLDLSKPDTEELKLRDVDREVLTELKNEKKGAEKEFSYVVDEENRVHAVEGKLKYEEGHLRVGKLSDGKEFLIKEAGEIKYDAKLKKYAFKADYALDLTKEEHDKVLEDLKTKVPAEILAKPDSGKDYAKTVECTEMLGEALEGRGDALTRTIARNVSSLGVMGLKQLDIEYRYSDDPEKLRAAERKLWSTYMLDIPRRVVQPWSSTVIGKPLVAYDVNRYVAYGVRYGNGALWNYATKEMNDYYAKDLMDFTAVYVPMFREPPHDPNKKKSDGGLTPTDTRNIMYYNDANNLITPIVSGYADRQALESSPMKAYENCRNGTSKYVVGPRMVRVMESGYGVMMSIPKYWLWGI